MQDLTTGSLFGHLLKTMGFMLVGMLFQTLYVLVDLYWVGHLGTEAVAAVSLGGNLTFIVMAVGQMLGVGTTTLIAHATGRKDREEAQIVFGQSQVLSILVGLIFFAAAMAFRNAYADALSPDAVTAGLARQYLTWFIPAMSMQFALVAMGSALRGTGQFMPGMIVHASSVVINMLLAPVFVFGWLGAPAMGVAGAAFATFIAIVLGTAVMTLYFLPATAHLTFAGARFRPEAARWWQILKIGVPAGLEFGLMAVYLLFVYSVTRRFGAAAQAGFGIGMRVLQSGFLPVVALGFAVAPVAGQNFGARRAQRVRQTFRDAAIMAAGAMVLFAVAARLLPEAMIRPFSNDPMVISTGAEYLRIVSWTFVSSGIIFVSSSMFQAMGNTVPSLVASTIRMVLVVVPLLIMSRLPGFELKWIWYVSATAITIQLLMSLVFLRREFRLRLAF